MKFYLPTILSVALFISCDDNKPSDTYVPLKDVLATPATANAQSPVPNSQASNNPAENTPSSSVRLNPAHGQPGHRCELPVGAALPDAPATTPNNNPANNPTPTQVKIDPVPPAQTTTSSNNKGLNPEHGKPGHRCDIAVGAPLNSKPAAQQTQTVTQTPAKTVTAPGMNPPHGEPGHRCDIPVGSPLNQAAAKTEKKDSSAVQAVKLVEKDSGKQ